jgi:hypothetical protein
MQTHQNLLYFFNFTSSKFNGKRTNISKSIEIIFFYRRSFNVSEELLFL